MVAIPLVFVVLVAGFVACYIHPVDSYKLHRFEGQYLYLKSSQMGLICLGWGLILCYLGYYLAPNVLLTLKQFMLQQITHDADEAAKLSWFFYFLWRL